MADKTLSQLTAEVVDIFEKYNSTGTNNWTAEIAAQDLPYQVGSLTKAMMQMAGNRFADGKSALQLRADLSDELADILAEVLFIAHELEIDLSEAFANMLKSDNKKIEERSS